MKLEKSERIRSLIKHLQQSFGPDSFKIKDFWEGDLEAIGLSNLEETRLIYLSTLHLPKGYYISLESGSINTDKFETEGCHENTSREKARSLFAEHLEIKVI